jgi:uroporphyrinogen-III synthase
VPPVVVCIGPVTAATARAAGLAVEVVAAEHSIDGVVDALVARLGGGPQPAGAPDRPGAP